MRGTRELLLTSLNWLLCMLKHSKAHENINLQTGAPKLDQTGCCLQPNTSLEAAVTYSTAVQLPIAQEAQLRQSQFNFVRLPAMTNSITGQPRNISDQH
jgi:hypothetical protein